MNGVQPIVSLVSSVQPNQKWNIDKVYQRWKVSLAQNSGGRREPE